MAKNKKKKGKKKKGKYAHWPKPDKLLEALETFEEFRAMCQHQMDLGYWATIDFPTKHHLNKLLSIQYMEDELLVMVYGKGLVKRAKAMIPFCKNYLAFVRESQELDTHVDRNKDNRSAAEASATN